MRRTNLQPMAMPGSTARTTQPESCATKATRYSESSHGLIASSVVTVANGCAEREAARTMSADAVQAKGDAEIEITPRADKGHDPKEFIETLPEMKITPHVAQNISGRKSVAPDATAAIGGYGISKQKKKLIEQGFDWGKVVGRMAQIMVRGLEKVDQMSVLTMTGYNPHSCASWGKSISGGMRGKKSR
jgi:hypothetical protein